MKNLITLFMIFSFLSCRTNSIKTPFNKPLTDKFDKQGHRGGTGLMPENTIPAFLHAIDLGVNTIEMDVVISRDQKVVVSHDPFFNYLITTKPDGSYLSKSEGKALKLYQMNYDQIIKYDVGQKPHPHFPHQQNIKAVKPLLTGVVDSVIHHMRTMRRPPVWYNIEIKSERSGDGIYHPKPSEFVELVMAAVRKAGIDQRTIIQSFDIRILQYMHKRYPEIKTALLISFWNRKSFQKNIKQLGYSPTTYSPTHHLVTSKLINTCHDEGILIIPWVINSKKEIERFKNMGVDGIITDYPNFFNE
jgi:glycerophosphoryl diester phosphodiesterase